MTFFYANAPLTCTVEPWRPTGLARTAAMFISLRLWKDGRLRSNCVIGAGARIKGPAVLGDGCSILTAQSSTMPSSGRMSGLERSQYPESVIGDNCSVGNHSVVEPGVLWRQCSDYRGSHLQTGQKCGRTPRSSAQALRLQCQSTRSQVCPSTGQ